MKKLLCLVLSVCMIATMFAMPVLAEDASTTASAQGFSSPVTVTLTIDGSKLTGVEIDASGETPALGGAAAANMAEAMLATNSVEVDAVAGATFTSTAVLTAAADALAQSGASLEAAAVSAVSFVPGTYEGTGTGCNGAITVAVTFTENAIEKIEVVASRETAQVGTPAFDIMIPEMIEYTSTGIDGVSGATFTSYGLKEAVTDAAVKAGCDPVAIRTGAKPFVVEAGEPIEATYDVVVVGAGGAGIAAAAQAAQDGNTVLVIEKNAQVGGNTLVSGGQYQSVMPYLVWDPADPDAETGVGFDGNTYNKVKESANTLKELKVILGWSEEAFDEEFYKTNEFVAGDIEELSKHGVHAEYLDTLKALKAEIQAYLDWAQPKVDAGEGTLTLFSTLNLHIFQTYYGGLRPTADMSSWIYGDYDLVSQFINDGQELKPWLEAQGSTFVEDTQPTLIGALWYRENQYIGAEIDGVFTGDRWGTYFVAPMNTLLNTSATAKENKIMTRTDAKELIVDNGRVVGVKATMFDGTPVTAMATKGVVLATGGYAANLDKVLSTNVYWSSEYISARTKTTNRSSLRGDGIAMGEAVGAATTGEGFTQMMPISWIDDGNLAFGGGNYAVYLNPVTGKRFVDETSERDVLSLAEFRNGIEVNGTKGVFIEVANLEQPIPGPYPYTTEDVEWRQYIRTTDQFAELFASLGLPTDAETVIETIKNYDAAIMAGVEPEGVNKTNANRIIGNADKDERGNYIPETYTLDGVALRVRFMAPSTHHTMGGLKVDVDRHVISTEGSIIPGLYAAGEVTGGIHGGNRLGGNAIVEIFVSGRTAAKAISADN